MEIEWLQGLLAAVATVMAVGVTASRIFRDFKKSSDRELEKAERREAEYAAPVDDLSQLLVQNFRVLNSYYSETSLRLGPAREQASRLPFSGSSR